MSWRYTLKNGKSLREAIEDYDDFRILDCLGDCWREIYEQFPDEYEDYELENDLAEIENQRDNVENYEDYDMTEEDVRDSIDYLLDELYDFCDNMRIWIDI